MTRLSPFPSTMRASASIALASFASILLYAVFDAKWWPRIGSDEWARGWALAFLHIVALLQFWFVIKINAMKYRRR